MSLLMKKLFRELREMKLRSIIIILSIAMSIAFYGGLLLLKQNVQESLDQTYETLHYEHAAFRSYNYFYPENISDLKDIDDNIIEIDYRLTLLITIIYQGKQYSSALHGISSLPEPIINRLSLENGNWITNTSENAVLMDQHFATPRHIYPGDKILIKLGEYNNTYLVKGIVFSPEYKYMVNPEILLPELGTYCALWTPINKAQEVLGIPGVINELFIRVKDYSRLNETIQKVNNYLISKGIQTRITQGTHELDHMFMQEDISFLDKYGIALSSITLLVAVFIIYDSVSKLIFSQKQIIGVLRALGATKKRLIVHYTSYGIILTIFGFIVGIPLGYGLTVFIRNMYVKLIGLPFVETYFSYSPFIKIGLVSLLVAVSGGAFATYRITKINPAAAMSGFEQRKPLKTPKFLDKLIEIISPKHKVSMKIPFRQVFGRKKRTVMTVVTIVIASLLVISGLGFGNSVNYQLDLYFSSYYKYQLEVYMSRPIDPNQVIPIINNLDGVIITEPMIRQLVTVFSKETNSSTFISAFKEDTQLRHYNFIEGNLKQGEIAVGKTLAKKLKISLGDNISIVTKAYDAPVANMSFRVSGMLAELMDNEVFIDLKTAQHFLGIDNNVTVFAVKVEHEYIAQVKQELENIGLPISLIKDLHQTRTSIETLMQSVITMNVILTAIGFLIVMLFSINVITLEVMDRDKEIINLRTNGASNWLIKQIIFTEVFFLALASAIISIPIGYYVTDWLMKKVMAEYMTMTTYIKPESFLINIGVILAGLGVGTIQAVRMALKTNLANATRIRFQT